jgi:hypothetical protein
MDARTRIEAEKGALTGRRALSLLPLSRKERTRYISDILSAAKARWGWKIDVVCQVNDRRPFEALVKPEGNIYWPPYLLKSPDWERDPAAVAALTKRLQEAELASGIPLGRMVLAGAHSVGRAFNLKLRYSNRYPLVLRMSRHNAEPFVVYRRLFQFCDDTIERSRPDLIISLDWSTPLHSCMWLAAKLRGVPCVSIRNSKIVPNHGYWSLDRLLLNNESLDRAAAKRTSKAPVSEAAREYVSGFRNRPKTIDYIANKWRDRTRRGFWRWHLEYGRTMVREIINTTKGQDRAMRERGIVRLYRYYRGLYLAWLHRRFLHSFDDAALAKTKYIYFPMHKEAELAQTTQATLWHDQRNTIRLLASILPAGYKLLAREHRLNYSLRPTRVYRQLVSIPNVVLLDPFDSQFKYLRHADLIITENGSSGWEGAVLRRPVITLARTFYDGADRTTKVEDPRNLNAAVLDALAKPADAVSEDYDHGLCCMVDAEFETTFPTGSTGIEKALDRLAAVVQPAFHARKAAYGHAAE